MKTDHPPSGVGPVSPTSSQPSETPPLPDARPFTLAAAYLRYRNLADVQTRRNAYDRSESFQKPVSTVFHHWREKFFRFERGAYGVLEIEDLRSDVNDFLNEVEFCTKKDKGVAKLTVNEKLKRDVFGQLRDLCQAKVPAMPAWLDGRTDPPPEDIIVFRNGLLDVPEWVRNPEIPLLAPTPALFTLNFLDRDYDPHAKCPLWERLLDQYFPDKPDLVMRVQEWFGYCLTGDTSMQKLLWLHGVSGSGKSTIASVLTMVAGQNNVVDFNLPDLADNFGLAKFIGKRVAISREAAIGPKDDSKRILAKLKQLSGNDNTSVNRKWRDEIESIRLLTRLVILTNEFPSLPDAADALARRVMFIPFTISFRNEQDTTLEKRLEAEVQGITLWAIRGLARLRNQGWFSKSPSSDDVAREFLEDQNKLHAFVREWCEQPGQKGLEGEAADRFFVDKDELFEAYKRWAGKSGITKTYIKPHFASRLFSTVKGLGSARPRNAKDTDAREHTYTGIRLKCEYIEVPETQK